MKQCLLALVILSAITGCSSRQTFWEKPGASARDFEMDRADCNSRAFAAPVNMYGFALIWNQCMQGKGWGLVERETRPNRIEMPSKASSEEDKTHPALRGARLTYDATVTQSCGRLDMVTIIEKTACLDSKISESQIDLREPFHPRYRNSFRKWRATLYEALESLTEAERQFGGEAGRRWSDYIVDQYLPKAKDNDARLELGDIDWGKYNLKRRGLSADLQRELGQR